MDKVRLSENKKMKNCPSGGAGATLLITILYGMQWCVVPK